MPWWAAHITMMTVLGGPRAGGGGAAMLPCGRVCMLAWRGTRVVVVVVVMVAAAAGVATSHGRRCCHVPVPDRA